MNPDPRALDLRVRTFTTAAIALIVTLAVVLITIRNGQIPTELAGWGAIIIGFYFGSHSSLNGAGARARQDENIVAAISEPATGPFPQTDTKSGV